MKKKKIGEAFAMRHSVSKLAIEQVESHFSYEDIKMALFSILDRLPEYIKLGRNAKILIKVNLCLLMGPETGATVDPRVARALVEWLLMRYDPKIIYLAEADATHLSADLAFQILGWRDYFEDFRKVDFVNLSKDERVTVQGYYLGDLEMSKKMISSDFLISLAKLKTHTQQKITCIMKNQFGAIPYKYKVIYHANLAEAIYDATAVRPPDLSIIDGLVAMEGNGPTNGVPRRAKLLLASNDAFSMDHYCARLMGFKPKRVPHLRLASKRGLGSSRYEVLGNPPDPLNLKFKFLPKWKEIVKKGIGVIQRGTINEEA